MSSFGPFDDDDIYQFETPPPAAPPPPASPRPEVNPYAAPEYVNERQQNDAYYGSGKPDEVVPTVVDIGEVNRHSWRIFSTNLGPCLGVCLLWLLVAGGGAFVIHFTAELLSRAMAGNTRVEDEYLPVTDADVQRMARDEFLKDYTTPLGLMGSILSGALATWMLVGFMRTYAGIARGEGADYALLFSGGDVFVMAIIYQFIFWCLISLPQVVLGGLFFHFLSPIQAAIAIYFVSMIMGVFSLLLYPGFWLIADRGMSVGEAMKTAIAISSRNLVTLIVLALEGGAVCVLGLLALLVGIVFALPFAYMLFIVFLLLGTGERLGQRNYLY